MNPGIVIDFEEDMEIVCRTGGFSSEKELLQQAFQALLNENPELRTELAVEKYREDEISLNRAAEITGMSPEEFKSVLESRGIKRKPGFLSTEDSEKELIRL